MLRLTFVEICVCLRGQGVLSCPLELEFHVIVSHAISMPETIWVQ